MRNSSPFGDLLGAFEGFLEGVNFLGETTSAFDLKADLQDEKRFYDLPYPFDWRLDESGRADLTGYPIWQDNPVLVGLRKIAGDPVGFSTLSRGYFRFNRPLAAQSSGNVIPATVDASVLLIDVDPESPERGTLYPTVASTPFPDPNYVPDFLLAVAPAPGIVLQPNRQYAFVVRRSLRNALGQPLGTPAALKRILRDPLPRNPLRAAAYNIFQPLRDTLPLIGLRRQDIAAATVFTTGDPVGEMARLSEQIVDRYDLTIDNLRLDPDDGATHKRFWEFHGAIAMPQFQTGAPPFNTKGRFAFTPEGELIQQRTENVPIVITIPKNQPMPAGGFPLMLYQHGSNGLSTQVVDRGPIVESGGEPLPGLGPAHVVAEYGIATVGSGSPLNPERFPGGGRDAYLNFANLAAYPDTFRQGVLELRLLLKALETLSISAEHLPTSESSSDARIDTSGVAVLGQSLGSQYANMLGAIDPKVEAVIPTGAPGFWSLLVPETELSTAAGALLGATQPLDPLYPGLNLLQTAWEMADPITYVPYLAQRPLAGHPARSIYMPVGQGDTEVPEPIFDAMALASGLKQVDLLLWPELQASLALGDFDGVGAYPVANNLTSQDGRPYTGSVVQYAGDGIADPHTIFSQLDAVKFQYGSFLKTLFEGGVAQVLEPPSE